MACCDKYYAAIDFYKASLGISLEIGTQWENATLLFNLGYAYIRIDRAWEALEAYQNALQLYQELELDKKVEKCEAAIRDINTMVVAEPRSALSIANIDMETPKQRKFLQTTKKRILVSLLVILSLVVAVTATEIW